ncbi:MAG: hypothetical protein ACTSVI_06495 [Promethearchaeota archaeon]
MSGTINNLNWVELTKVLNYIEIEGKIDEDIVLEILKRLDLTIDTSQVHVKSYWHKFKQFDIYNVDKQPILFIKELWQPGFLREILGLHIGINFLDKELGPKKYLFGKWTRNNGKIKPILITTYVKGKSLNKKKIKEHAHALGRQHAYHLILSMYDVHQRHFIVNQGTLLRIDYGRAFTNLKIKYQGFWDFKHKYLLKNVPAYKVGIEKEFKILENNLKNNKKHLLLLIELLENLGNGRNFFVDFDVPKFVNELKEYWKKNSPFEIA